MALKGGNRNKHQWLVQLCFAHPKSPYFIPTPQFPGSHANIYCLLLVLPGIIPKAREFGYHLCWEQWALEHFLGSNSFLQGLWWQFPDPYACWPHRQGWSLAGSGAGSEPRSRVCDWAQHPSLLQLPGEVFALLGHFQILCCSHSSIL